MAQKNADFRDGYAYRAGGKQNKGGKPSARDVNSKVQPELSKSSGGEPSEKGEAPKHFTGHTKEKSNKALSLQGDTAGHMHYDYSDGCHSGYKK